MKNILISGGWGYKNIGDDAILKSTVKLVQKKFPDSKLTITSYNPTDSRQILSSDNIIIINSVYRIIFGKGYSRIYYNENLITKQRLFDKVKNKVYQYFSFFFVSSIFFILINFKSLYFILLKTFYHKIYEQFEGIDLFIMSGGGYFNSWEASLISRFTEIEVAKKNNIRTLLIGQTIGPFKKKRQLQVAKDCLLKCDLISVRDKKSFNELTTAGIIVHDTIIPDLALAETKAVNKKKKITLVPFAGPEIQKKKLIICETFKEIQKETKIEITIAISQYWKAPVQIAQDMYDYLIKLGCNVSLNIPSNLDELETTLEDSKVVVSQNLHGLILAYRAGCSIVSLNNKRKFRTFMSLTDNSDLTVDMKNLNRKTLKELITKSLKRESNFQDRTSIAALVEKEFNECIDRVSDSYQH